jgi:hypothetical protein
MPKKLLQMAVFMARTMGRARFPVKAGFQLLRRDCHS